MEDFHEHIFKTLAGLSYAFVLMLLGAKAYLAAEDYLSRLSEPVGYETGVSQGAQALPEDISPTEPLSVK